MPGRLFAYRIGFPSSLLRAGGSFRLEPTGEESCELVQETHFGFALPVIGQIADLVLRLALPVGEFRRHMREEGQGLADLLETVADRRRAKSKTVGE